MSRSKINAHIKTPRVPRWAAGGLVAAAFVLSGDGVVAQPAGETGRVLQFENDQVKVWKSVVQPHAPLPLHRHEHPRVIIALVGGTMKIVEQSGSTETHDWRSGNAYWLPANAPGTMHQDVNAGDKPIEVMVVELKTAK
jgi:quercetin dioxygenase-like cupin family protein